MESSGQRGRVHLSEQTAAELAKYGKSDWIIPRDDIVELKGKGMLNTYWFKRSMENPAAAAYPSTVATSESNDSDAYEVGWPEGKVVDVAKSGGPQRIQASIQRLVDWNCELLLQLLELVAARDLDQSDVNK
jgi:hypothetical protein